MKTHISLEHKHADELPEPFRSDDVRYPETLVERFLREFTQPGDTVLDPFAGYGTTLAVAERLGRTAYGVELDEARVAYARGRLAYPQNLLLADSRSLSELNLPPIDFSITSPPYMSSGDTEDPLSAYRENGRGYVAYLEDLRSIYAQLRERMKPSAPIVVEVANLKVQSKTTTLAWDVGRELSKVLQFEGEVVVCWDHYGFGYDHSYCLIYSARRPHRE